MNAIKKRAWKSEQLSTKSEHLKDNKDNKVDWRRNKVLELSSQGYSQRDIASTLQVGLGTVNKDILFLRQMSQENLQHHIHERVPEEYQTV
jgi:DNA-binding NarL/FixJ family response regulator